MVKNKIPIMMTRSTAIMASKMWIAMMATIMRNNSPKARKRRRRTMRTTIMTYATQRVRKRRWKVRRTTNTYSNFS